MHEWLVPSSGADLSNRRDFKCNFREMRDAGGYHEVTVTSVPPLQARKSVKGTETNALTQ